MLTQTLTLLAEEIAQFKQASLLKLTLSVAIYASQTISVFQLMYINSFLNNNKLIMLTVVMKLPSDALVTATC